MESHRIMDRLICGDVGYGKTEVAIRAAFKAVMDSKQVVYLVPTTILAQQHYNSFKERMEHYPVEIAMLSRFSAHQKYVFVLLACKNEKAWQSRRHERARSTSHSTVILSKSR